MHNLGGALRRENFVEQIFMFRNIKNFEFREIYFCDWIICFELCVIYFCYEQIWKVVGESDYKMLHIRTISLFI